MNFSVIKIIVFKRSIVVLRSKVKYNKISTCFHPIPIIKNGLRTYKKIILNSKMKQRSTQRKPKSKSMTEVCVDPSSMARGSS